MAPDSRDELGRYLDSLEIRESARIDLDTYARDTAHIALGLGERLRRLAVYLEDTRGIATWSMLEPVFDAALKADPDNPHTWSSWAIARLNTDPDNQQALETCVAAARRAASLDPEGGHTHAVLGMLLYQAEQLEEAQRTLEHAISLGESGWPHLWLAHTLHDQERWVEAADAYAGIAARDLPAEAAWRVSLAQQQRAACLLRAGRREEASNVYSHVLEAFERALDAELDSLSSPVLALGPPDHLLSDIDALPELAERAAMLRQRLDAHPDPMLRSPDENE